MPVIQGAEVTQEQTLTRPDRVVFGAMLIVGAVFLMALQDAIIKYASTDLTLWQIYVLRSLIAIPVLAIIARRCGQGPMVLTRSLARWTMLRAALLVAMYVSLYAAIPVLPLAVLAAGFYTAPLFIALLSALLIGEPVRLSGWLALATGFAGVLFILKPGTAAFTPMVLLPVLSGLLYAVAAILARSKCRDEAPLTLAMSLNIVLLLAGALASVALAIWPSDDGTVLPFLSGPWVRMGVQAWTLVVVLAVLIVGIGLGLAAAYQVARPAVIATFDYSYLIFSSLFGYVLFAEVPDAATLVGMALIGGAGLLVIRR